MQATFSERRKREGWCSGGFDVLVTRPREGKGGSHPDARLKGRSPPTENFFINQKIIFNWRKKKTDWSANVKLVVVTSVNISVDKSLLSARTCDIVGKPSWITTDAFFTYLHIAQCNARMHSLRHRSYELIWKARDLVRLARVLGLIYNENWRKVKQV